MNLDSLPGGVLYGIAQVRWRYGRNVADMEDRLQSQWFLGRIYSHMGGEQPRWECGNYAYDPKSKRILKDAQDFMREFCLLSDREVEAALVKKSPTEAARFSVKVKNARFDPEVEKAFLDGCKGKKSKLNALLTYCGHWGIMPENMTEITLVAGFEGGRRGELSKEYMKRLQANKKTCRELLEQIMRMNEIPETEPISRVLEHLT